LVSFRSAGLGRVLNDLLGGGSNGSTARYDPHQELAFHAAETSLGPAHNSVATDTPAISAARFIARSPSAHSAWTRQQSI
jgi:hypothetical protein